MWGWLEPGREAQPRGVMDKIEQEIKATGSGNQEPPPPSLEKSLGFLAGLLSISRWVSLKLQLVYRALKERAVIEAGGLGAVRLKLLFRDHFWACSLFPASHSLPALPRDLAGHRVLEQPGSSLAGCGLGHKTCFNQHKAGREETMAVPN